MFDEIELGSEFFDQLTAIDEAILENVARKGCPECGARLHRGDYPRKPRGGLIGAFAETLERRFSLCCSREGCRRRATPPSVRFLGRRVYVGAIVIIASVIALAAGVASEARRKTGIAPRTTRRWGRWWRDTFPTTPVFVALAGRFVPAIERRRLPTSLLKRLASDDAPDVLRVGRMLAWLAPLTTMSVDDGARFVRAIA